MNIAFDGFRRYAHARVITDFKNMADYMKSEHCRLPKRRKRRQERLPQDYKRLLRRDIKCWKRKRSAEKRLWIETQNKFVDILFALNSYSICSLFDSEVSLYFVHGRLSFYYFKILTYFTCKRIRANVGITRNLCG